MTSVRSSNKLQQGVTCSDFLIGKLQYRALFLRLVPDNRAEVVDPEPANSSRRLYNYGTRGTNPSPFFRLLRLRWLWRLRLPIFRQTLVTFLLSPRLCLYVQEGVCDVIVLRPRHGHWKPLVWIPTMNRTNSRTCAQLQRLAADITLIVNMICPVTRRWSSKQLLGSHIII